ncbi:MAG TPA: hypothetical protein VLA64_07435 [Azonexus sp.]|nr:hypothetical protein [Azonexus sp.]
MSNPFLKKNPFMSMVLSGANRIAGTIRGQATAQAKRQINAAVTKATNDNLKTMLGGTAPAAPKAKPKRRR